MPGRLVQQLVEAGLVTDEQAHASDPGDPLVPASRVIQNLVARGLDERILAGFFVSLGFGPVLHAAELDRADRELVRRLPATDAHDLCAMPLRASAAGVIVAMADPTDARAVDRLRESLGPSILPTVAKLSDLLDAVERAYPPDRPTLVSDPRALLGSRSPSGVVPLPRNEGTTNLQSKWASLDSPPSDWAATASPVWDRAWNGSVTERDMPAAPKSGATTTPSARAALVDTDLLDRALGDLAHATTRDEAVRIACEACESFARGGAFLVLRKGVFRGWHGAGEDVTEAGIRSLWIPASNPSILNEVLHRGQPFRGVYGDAAADHLFRAAFGSRGREVAVVPVLVGARMVGVLCADDPVGDTDLLEGVSKALAEALERVILSHKSRN